MPEEAECPKCGFLMEISDESSRGNVTCPSCGRQIATINAEPVPAAGEPTEAPRNCGCLLGKVVVGLVLLLLAVVLLWPRQNIAREAPRRAACINNMKELGLALRAYRHEHGRFPPPYTVDENGNRLHSWRTLILPYIEQRALFAEIQLDEPWNSEHNRKFASTAVRAYHCPSHGNDLPSRTDYVMITGPGTFGAGTEGIVLDDITDNARQTAIIAEVAQSDIHWMEPRDYDSATGSHRLVAWPEDPINPADLSSCHPGVVNMLMVDGSVKCVPVGIDEKTFKALMTIRGGEEVEVE